MSQTSGRAPSVPDQLLASWSLSGCETFLISDHGNVHWRVEAGRERYVLRRYRPEATAAQIAYELALLDHLEARGWPVAPAIDDTCWYDGQAFVLFPYLPGVPRPSGADTSRARGRLLARLHQDLVGLTGLGQKPGWKLVDEDLADNLSRWRAGKLSIRADIDTNLAQVVISHLLPVHNRLTGSGIDQTPPMIVHSDLINQNVLCDGDGNLTGLLDLDQAHLDRRGTDIASGRRRDDDEFVHGYLEIVSLEASELAVLDDIYRARVLSWGLALLEGRVSGGDQDAELRGCVDQLTKTQPYRP